MHLFQSISASSLSTRKYQYNSDYKQCATFQITLYAFLYQLVMHLLVNFHIISSTRISGYSTGTSLIPRILMPALLPVVLIESELHLKERICHLQVHLKERICHLQVRRCLFIRQVEPPNKCLQNNAIFPEYIKMIKVTRVINCMIIPVVYGN